MENGKKTETAVSSGGCCLYYENYETLMEDNRLPPEPAFVSPVLGAANTQ
jgi:hypothetical protein